MTKGIQSHRSGVIYNWVNMFSSRVHCGKLAKCKVGDLEVLVT
jgi:hypothetical protein